MPSNMTPGVDPPGADKSFISIISVLLAIIATAFFLGCISRCLVKRKERIRREQQNIPLRDGRTTVPAAARPPRPSNETLPRRYKEVETPPPAYSAGRERVFEEYRRCMCGKSRSDEEVVFLSINHVPDVAFTPSVKPLQPETIQQGVNNLSTSSLIMNLNADITLASLDVKLLVIWTGFLLGVSIQGLCDILSIQTRQRRGHTQCIIRFRRSKMRRWTRQVRVHAFLLAICRARVVSLWFNEMVKEEELPLAYRQW
ncbi:hypothetical protein M409DRAFT_54223 [Zasmidium cellare ATCC 36951]|uniref:Transmembrane protein n=1 Tax=Zasmidium cellare ATCC 36951 TaxID=1080233 RepID=A0A6A6CIG2_ZASCE|nr:uncharacterized protein M409DRAFT_54223 [Zasmidium cellare ATCC 36951]KAF2167004.1 hypothetical protein M409DRAFT_54223 [Zasmidium cellare ATCC 36951]